VQSPDVVNIVFWMAALLSSIMCFYTYVYVYVLFGSSTCFSLSWSPRSKLDIT